MALDFLPISVLMVLLLGGETSAASGGFKVQAKFLPIDENASLLG